MAGSRSPHDGLQRTASRPSGRDWMVCGESGGEPSDTACPDGSDSPDGLALIIEREIVPRLMLIHQTAKSPKTAGRSTNEAGGRHRVGARAVRSFAERLLADDAASATTYLADRLARGHAPSALCLDLLAPAARHLGRLWETDTIDFVQVTLALHRLHALLKILRMRAEIEPGEGGRSILLVPTPGDSHIFGRAIVGEFFRASGWLVEGELIETRPEIEAAVANRMFSVVGFSLGTEVLRSELRSLIAAVRRGSLNASIRILVGGPVFSALPDMVGEVGADGWAADAAEAVRLAESFVMPQQLATGGRG